MTKIEFNLADDIASQARAAGLLEQEKLESLLRAKNCVARLASGLRD